MARHGVRNGFTLVELLIVIAIISVLAAMLLPALQQALESARQIVCASRMKQVGMYTNMYSGEYRCIIPTYMSTARNKGVEDSRFVGMRAQNLLYAAGYLPASDLRPNVYARDAEGCPDAQCAREDWPNKLVGQSVLLCPSALFRSEFFGHTGGGGMATTEYEKLNAMTESNRFAYYSNGSSIPYQYMSVFYSYPFNSYLSKWSFNGGWTTEYYFPLKSVKTPPSKLIHFMEIRQGNGLSWDTVSGSWFNSLDYWKFRHGDMANYACMDGHVGRFDAEMKTFVNAIIPTLPLGYKYDTPIKQRIINEYKLTLTP